MPKRPIRETAIRLIIGITADLVITWIAYHFHFNLSSATSVHLFLVTVIALKWGFREASVVSLLSVGCLDYFFTQPLFQFYMSDSHDWVALITFESVALLVSRLSNQVNHHVRELEVHRSNLQKLYELSQQILLLDHHKPVDRQLVDLMKSTLRPGGVALWNAYEPQLCRSGNCSVTEEELRAIYFSERNEDDIGAATSRRVLRSGTRAIGALAVAGHSLDAASINATASLAAVAIERARSFSAESSAEAARQSEQLRSAVLDGLAHAFKTPLTTIRSSSSGLIEMDTLSGTEKRLVALIDQQAECLDDLTTRLLRTARIDSASIKVKRERMNLIELVHNTLVEYSQEPGAHIVVLDPEGRDVMVTADQQLLKMVLFQLFDNAAKYGSQESSISVGVREETQEVLVSVRNEGSFIPPEERERVFRRFYRSPGSNLKAAGTGIGLSVVKQIIDAHQGRTWVNSEPNSGTTFMFTLPRTTNEE